MPTLRRFGQEHPRLTALFILLLSALMFSLPILIYGTADLADSTGLIPLDYLTGAIGPQVGITAAILVAVALLGWWRATYLTTPVDSKGLRTALWITAVPFLFFVGIATTTPSDFG